MTRRTFLQGLGVVVAVMVATPGAFARDLLDKLPRRRLCYETGRYRMDCPCYDQGLSRTEQARRQVGVVYEPKGDR